MVKAYVLVETTDVDPNTAATELTEIEEVENVHIVYGKCDIICLAKADNVIDLKEVVLQKIGQVRGVTKTSCFIIADEE